MVDLQELAGDITAVGAVTQESGQRIGTALRTIYSRITTIDAVRPALDEVGISLYEMGNQGPQIRDVSDILQDLGGIWQDLNAEQQQNIGITIAGRARITQFLALMNNYQTAIDATTTAYNSQGSAMREQREYMGSYEYQMKVMGATATDLALIMEDKLVGDAMYLVITSMTDLLDVLGTVFDRFGVLPTVMGAGATAFFLFGGDVSSVTGLLGTLGGKFTGLVNGLAGYIASVTGATGATAKLKIALMGFKTLGVVAVIAGIGWVIEKLVSQMAEARRATEDARYAMDEAIDGYNSFGQNIDGLIDRYDELHYAMQTNKDDLSIDEQREYYDIINQIATIIPESVSHIDAQGQAHLRNSEMIREQVSSIHDLAKANEEMVAGNRQAILNEQADKLGEITKRIQGYGDAIRQWDISMNSTSWFQGLKEFEESKGMTGIGAGLEWLTGKLTNHKKISEEVYEAQQNLLASQYELSSGIQEASISIGDQAVSMMSSSGAMENVSTSAQAMIRDYASINSVMLEGLETPKEIADGLDMLMERNLLFGEIVQGVYDDLSEGMNGISTESAIENFDALVNALPADFFKQSLAEISSDFDALGSIITMVMSGAKVDVDELVQTLVDSGMESEMAIRVVRELGVEFQNQSIQTAVANEELTQYNDELALTRDLALETIDPLEKLFGISSGDITSMQSHIDLLQILRGRYGDMWTTMDQGAESIAVLADYFGVSEEYIRQNIDEIALALQGMKGVSVEYSEKTGEAFLKFDEDMDKTTRRVVENLLNQGDAYQGFTTRFVQDTGIVMQSQEELDVMTESLQNRFDAFLNDPVQNNFELVLSEVNGQLKELDGTFVIVEDSLGNFKLQMADGSDSEYFDNLNKMIEKTGFSLEYLTETRENEQGEQIVYNAIALAGYEDQVRAIYEVNQSVQEGQMAIGDLTTLFREFRKGTMSQEEEQTFITMLQNQIDLFGENLVTVTDEAGNLKLEFEGGYSSPWLDGLNAQLEESDLSVVEVRDELYNVGFALQNEAGQTFFSSLKEGAKGSAEEIDKVKNATDELDRTIKHEREGQDGTQARAIHIDTDDAVTSLGRVETKIEDLDGAIRERNVEGSQARVIHIDDVPAIGALEKIEEKVKEVDGVITKERDGMDGTTARPIAIDNRPAIQSLEEIDEKTKEVDKTISGERDGADSTTARPIRVDNQPAIKSMEEVEDKVDEMDSKITKQRDGQDGTTARPIAVDNKPAIQSMDEVEDKVDEMDRAIRGERDGADGTTARPIRVDNKSAIDATEEIKGSVEQIGKDPIDLKIDINSVNSINDVLDTLGLAQIELQTTEQKLEALRKDLRVTGESLETIMSNIDVLTQANNSVTTLSDNIGVARQQLGELYDMFANRNIDVSGLSESANRIAQEADKMDESFQSILNSILGTNRAIETMAPRFDISPIVNYRAGVQTNISAILQIFSHLRSGVKTYMDYVTAQYRDNGTQLGRYRVQVEVQLSLIMNLHKRLSQSVSADTEQMSQNINTSYLTALANMVRASIEFNTVMQRNQQALTRALMTEMTNMGVQMNRNFRNHTDSIVDIASSLPRRIGMGVRANMESASNSMTALAQNMVRRFKQELGIHSPSRVFQGLGGDVIDGLVNGLSDRNLVDLGQNVFSDFSDGAISTIDQIKGYMTFEPTTSGSFGSMFTRTSSFGPRKSPGGIGSTNHRGVDYGAPAGTPIPSQSSGTVVASGYNGVRGNYVIIESSNGVRHLYQHNSRNNVRVGQMVGRGQNIGTVGSTGASTGAHLHYEVHINGVPIDPEKYFRGFAEGGFVDKKELAWHGEEGLEAIIPLKAHRKERGLDLWAETGEILGLNAEILQMMISSQRKTGSTSGASRFAGLDGEAGSGSSETATSGIVKPDYSSVMRSLGIEEQPMFAGLGPSDLEELYRRDTNAVAVGRHSAMVRRAETELRALTEQTLKYRNALEEVNLQENRLRNATQKQLTATVKRQSQIEKELGKLRNTSKHTEEQRRKYNQLQQEFDRNTEAIYNMENEIRSLNISMNERKVAIYRDYIGQLAGGFQKLRDEIAKTTSDLQFSLDYMSLTDENNVGGQLKIQYDILRESMRMESTLLNNLNKFQAEYNTAVRKYGKNSEQALLVRQELYSVEEQYQRTVLDRVRLERTIENTRKDVAKQGIDTLKNYYRQTQTMTERAIEMERRALEKAHERKMSMYDDEIAKIRSIYDTRLNEMDEERAEQEYNESISRLNTQRVELMNQISRASRDTSLEGRKRLAEIQSQLAEVNQEIEKTQADRQDTLYRQALERQRDEQINALEVKKQREEQEQNQRMMALDKQLEDAKAYTERMINDDAMWERITNEFVSGNTHVLSSMMEEMTQNMSRYMSGNFAGVSMGFADLSKEDRESFADSTLLEISNLMVNASESMERFVSTSNERVQNIDNVRGQNYNVGAMTNFGGSTLSTQGKTGPTIPAPPPPAPRPVQDNRHHTVVKGDTLWDLAQKFYGNPYQWTKIAQANHNPDPRKLQIGRKLLIPFDTGGLNVVHFKNFELLETPKAC